LKKIELLAPAGDFDKLKIAFHYGADAVYLGLKRFSLRANTGNFSDDELVEAVEYTRKLGKKLFVAMNVYFMPDQMESFIEQAKFIGKVKPDGVIISDMGAVYIFKRYAPEVPIHISTQANTTNQAACQLYKELGVERVVVARELKISDIRLIKNSCDIELEAFVHGAMCIAYSGRCLLSSYMTVRGLGARTGETKDDVRSANSGDCSHSCRWEYALKEVQRDDQEFPVEQDDNGSYILSSKDICMIDHIPEMIDAGVDSLKIEGRMKSILYISSIVRAYRTVIDAYYDNIEVDRELIYNELNIVSHREFSTGFFFDRPMENPLLTLGGVYTREMRLAALFDVASEYGRMLKIYNKISEKESLELVKRGIATTKVGRVDFYDKNGALLSFARHCDTVSCRIFDISGEEIKTDQFDILRMTADF